MNVTALENDAGEHNEKPAVEGPDVQVVASRGHAVAQAKTDAFGVAGLPLPVGEDPESLVVRIEHEPFNARHMRLDGTSVAEDVRHALYGSEGREDAKRRPLQPARGPARSRGRRPACDHLPGAAMPSVKIQSTAGGPVEVAEISRVGRTVFFLTPAPAARTSRRFPPFTTSRAPEAANPQSCAFRDHYSEFEALGVRVFGISAQNTEYQREIR